MASIRGLPAWRFFGDDWVFRNYLPNDPGPIQNGAADRILYFIGSFGPDGVSMFEVKQKFQGSLLTEVLTREIYTHRILVQRRDDSVIVPPFYFDLSNSPGNVFSKTTLPFYDSQGEVVPWDAQLDANGKIIPILTERRKDALSTDFWVRAEQLFSEGLDDDNGQ